MTTDFCATGMPGSQIKNCTNFNNKKKNKNNNYFCINDGKNNCKKRDNEDDYDDDKKPQSRSPCSSSSKSFININIKNNYNINNNEEPKYLHKKFQKMAGRDVTKTLKVMKSSTSDFPSIDKDDEFEVSLKEILPNFVNKCINFTKVTEQGKLDHDCPYCKLSCTKLSVLQKHIRAHTNERPYPCVPCGFSFKTKSNLYKHCKSKAHIFKLEEADTFKFPQELEINWPENIFNGIEKPSSPVLNLSVNNLQTIIPSNCNFISHSNTSLNFNDRSYLLTKSVSNNYSFGSSSNINKYVIDGGKSGKIYKPKFHTFFSNDPEASKIIYSQSEVNVEQYVNNKSPGPVVELNSRKLSRRQQSAEPMIDIIISKNSAILPRKRCYSENFDRSYSRSIIDNNKSVDQNENFYNNYSCDLPNTFKASYLESNIVKDQEIYSILQPMSSPGPLLGSTRLVDAQTRQFAIKRTRNESESDDSINLSTSQSLQMFGGKVQILDQKSPSKGMNIKTSTNNSSGLNISVNCDYSPKTSVFVRSSLQSGGIILQKICNNLTEFGEKKSIAVSEVSDVHNIVPCISPSTSGFDFYKSKESQLTEKFSPSVPGIPGPNKHSATIEPLDLALLPSQSKELSKFENNVDNPFVFINFSRKSVSASENKKITDKRIIENKNKKFLRPSSLSLKPDTYFSKKHHGITPTSNTIPLISPETPRPKKSYGQLYLNGHAYTYLGLKCSTRLSYCTLNRPQPMYVIQQHSLSMYSNWKICDDEISQVKLAHYDSRQRSARYTQAHASQDIIVHSSLGKNIFEISDNSLKIENLEKNKRIKIFDGGFESNEDYTYVRGRGRGRYVCEECGIRCKKPSMLKKHIRTHTDVRPFICKYCTFSFKTKGNLTKHMKSKSHFKKCVDLQILPVPTMVCDENIDKEALNLLLSAGVITDETSSEEDESEVEESEESGSEEQEAAQSLLSLAHSRLQRSSGLMSHWRPTTYPYLKSACRKNDYGKHEHQNNPDVDFKKKNPLISNIKTLASYSLRNKTGPESIRTLSESQISDRKTAASIDFTSKFHKFNPSTIFKSTNNVDSSASDCKIYNEKNSDFINKPESHAENFLQNIMLHAYITERHVLDSKIKQQYYVKNTDEKQESLAKLIKMENIKNKESEKVAQDSEKVPVSSLKKFKDNNHNKNIYDISSIVSSEIKSDKIIEKIKQTDDVSLLSQKSTFSIAEYSQNMSRSSLIENIVHPKKFISGFPQLPTNSANVSSIIEDNRNICNICNKIFNKPSQLKLHINIHYFERPFRCESCGTSFRTKGHLAKHERSTLHHNKVSMTSAFGTATASNPRPFKCTDCKSAFRIHGHLAKHLRSKMHIMKLECLRKLPFGTYAEMERCGINLNDIDTIDCDTSLTSLQIMAQKLHEKDNNNKKNQNFEIIFNSMSRNEDISFDKDETNSDKKSECDRIDLLKNLPGTIFEQSIEYNKLENVSYKCQQCLKSMKNFDELQIHEYIEHNLKFNSSSIHEYSEKKECSYINKKNTPLETINEHIVYKELHKVDQT